MNDLLTALYYLCRWLLNLPTWLQWLAVLASAAYIAWLVTAAGRAIHRQVTRRRARRRAALAWYRAITRQHIPAAPDNQPGRDRQALRICHSIWARRATNRISKGER